MLRGARLGCEVCEVNITGGERAALVNGVWNVPKQDLIHGLGILLERGMLRIARDLKGCRMPMREMMDMQIRESRAGGVRMGADGYGQHDDLVMAPALACRRAKSHKDRYLPTTVRLF
jgi:hypothetical protein